MVLIIYPHYPLVVKDYRKVPLISASPTVLKVDLAQRRSDKILTSWWGFHFFFSLTRLPAGQNVLFLSVMSRMRLLVSGERLRSEVSEHGHEVRLVEWKS
jgi:hypothetical protein